MLSQWPVIPSKALLIMAMIPAVVTTAMSWTRLNPAVRTEVVGGMMACSYRSFFFF
jgi:hypothetical protein